MEKTRSWRPRATIETLRARARFFSTVRAYFARHGVIEVDTPILSRAATVDRHIESVRVDNGGWLQTSPEFAMKRLLAAGVGPCYQFARVFRDDEQGRLHQPEFVMLEWYRPGWDHMQLMDEVETVVRTAGALTVDFERMTYQDAFQRHVGCDPLTVTPAQLRRQLKQHDVALPECDDPTDIDFWLDLCMGVLIAPQLGTKAPCFIYDFPVSQAALANIRPGNPPVAERFELFWRGVELANGFHELCDADEQARRFQADLDWRARHKRAMPPKDERFLAALEAGMPASAGVAVGVDRLLMLLLNLPGVADAMTFDSERI